MSIKQQRKINGNGAGAKKAAARWAHQQTLTKGAYGGPVRLLTLIVAVGVPLACYSLSEAHVGGWWPLVVAFAAPGVVLTIKWLVERTSIKREHAAHPHPLLPNSDLR